MARIFISYSRKNEDIARRLASDLDRLGADVWIDVDDIPAGMKWSTAIQQGLNMCEVMIVIISPDSMASVNVEDEWQAYLDDGKPVIPILWRPATVHFQLRRIQYIDFHDQGYDDAFKELYAELEYQLTLLSLPDSTVLTPLSIYEKRSGRVYWRIGMVALVLVTASLIIMLNGVLSGGDVRQISTDTPNPETAAAQILTQAVQPTTSNTPDITLTI